MPHQNKGVKQKSLKEKEIFFDAGQGKKPPESLGLQGRVLVLR
jgi:hypothetical protein